MAMIFAGMSVLAIVAHAGGEERYFRIISRDGPAIAIASKDLEGIETPASRQPPGASLSCLRYHTRSEALTSVLHNHQDISRQQTHYPYHVRHIAARCTGMMAFVPGFIASSILPQSILKSLPTSTRTGLAPTITMRQARGHKGMRRPDHFVSCPNAGGPQGQCRAS